MIESSQAKNQLYMAAVVALLLLMSLVNGFVAVAAAALLFVIGLVIYPNMRRTAITSGLVAAVVAIVIVALRTLF
jgi:hypothetical protein